MDDVGEPGLLLDELLNAPAHLGELALAFHPFGVGRCPRLLGLGQRLLEHGQCVLGAGEDRARGLDLACPPLLAGDRAGPLRAFGLGSPLELLGPPGQGPGPLLSRAQREPRLHLRRPRLRRLRREAVPQLGRGLLVVAVLLLGRLEPLDELRQRRPVVAEGGLRDAQCRAQPARLGLRGARRRTELPQLFPHRGQPGVGVVQPFQRGLDPLLARGAALTGCLHPGPRLPGPPGGRCHRVLGLVDGRLHLQQRGRRGGSAADEPRRDDVALEGDRGESGLRGDELRCAVEIGDDGDAVQQPVEGGGERHGGPDERAGPSGARRGRRPGGVREQGPGGGTCDDDARLAAVVRLQQAQGSQGGGRRLDGDGVGGHPERGCDGVLVAGLHREQGRDRAEQARELLPRGEQGAAAVPALEPQLEGLPPGRPGGPLLLGVALGAGGVRQLLLDLGQVGRSGLVLGVQALLTGLRALDLRLERLELGPRDRRTLLRLADLGDEAVDLLLAGLDPATAGRDLPGEPGQSLPPVRGGTQQPPEPALLLGLGPLGIGPGVDDVGEVVAGCGHGLGQGLLLLPDCRGLRLELLGITPAEPLRALSVMSASSRRRSAAREAVPRTRSRRLDSRYHVSCALACRGDASAAASSSSPRRRRAPASCSSTSTRRARRAVSSATSCSRVVTSVTRSSASRRARASRRSACTTWARRATSAWRPSGLSWRRISAVRSASRVRFACIASSLRSAFSLRLRCLRTPAASSMKARRSSGLACRTASSWPWPTMTCISRPIPESESSSEMSSSRQGLPLIAYSEPPERNIVRLIVTSA